METVKTKFNMKKNDRVVVLTGAGISSESGLKIFRGTNGYWKKYDGRKLAKFETFKNDPELVWDFYKRRIEKVQKVYLNKRDVVNSEVA